jgi:hypothetical protein
MRKRLALLALLCGLLSAGCNHASQPDGTLVNHGVGSEWKYSGHLEVRGKQYDIDATSTVKDKRRSPAGHDVQVLETVSHIPAAKKTESELQLGYTDARGSFLCGMADNDGVVHWLKSPQTEALTMSNPMHVGLDETADVSLDDGTSRHIERKVEAVEPIEVKAGRFVCFRCLTLFKRTTGAGPAHEARAVEWYLPAVGLIKSEQTHPTDKSGDIKITLSLDSYNLKN